MLRLVQGVPGLEYVRKASALADDALAAARRLAISVGDTVLVTADGCETLTKMGTHLRVN